MASETTNYKLVKPDPEEFYDVGVQNSNLDKIDTALKELEDNKIESVNSKTGKNVQITSEDITTINPMHPNQTIIDYPLGLSIFHTQGGYRNEWNDVLYQMYTPKHTNGHYRAIVETFKHANTSAKQKVSYIRSTNDNPSQGEVEVVFERGVQGNKNSAWGPWRRVLTDTAITDSLNVDDSTKVASAKAVKTVNDNLTSLEQTVTSHLADYVKHPAYAVATGSANAYSVTLNPAPTSYVEGMAIAVKINVDNTGASTINVNGLGAKAIKKPNGNDVSAGNLKAGSIYTLRYNGTNFILQGEGGGGTATEADLLEGKTAVSDAGDLIGTMKNNGAVTITPGQSDIIIPQGYHNGQGVVKKVEFDASKVLTGTTIAGKSGTMPNRGSIGTVRPGTTNKNFAAGYYEAFAVEGDPELIPSNILSGKNIFGVAGNVTLESLGGVKYASGTVDPLYYASYEIDSIKYTVDGSSFIDLSTSVARFYDHIQVSGLSFKPNTIVVTANYIHEWSSWRHFHKRITLIYSPVLLNSLHYDIVMYTENKTYDYGELVSESITSPNFYKLGKDYYVNSNGFRLPFYETIGNKNKLTWYAFG